MATIQGSSRAVAPSVNTTVFGACTNTVWHGTTTEADNQILVKTDGDYSMMRIRISENLATTNCTLRFRKNGANGNQVVTVPFGAGNVGYFEDVTNSDSVSTGDLICTSYVAGATGTTTIRSVVMKFQATTGECITYAAASSSPVTVSAASTTTFCQLTGQATITNTVENNARYKFRSVGTMRNARWRVTTNARGTNTIIRGRLNGANGNILITCTASTTGTFEDTSNTDTLASGDDYNWAVTTGTGSGNFSVIYGAIDFIPANVDYMVFNSNNVNFILPSVTRTFTVFGGRGESNVTNVTWQYQKMIGSATISNLRTFLISNGITSNSTLTFLINGVSGNQSVTYIASTAGAYEDTSNTDNVVDGDEIAYQLTTGSGGTNVSMSYYGVLINPDRHPSKHNFFAFM